MKLRDALTLSLFLSWGTLSAAQQTGSVARGASEAISPSTFSGGIRLRSITGAPFSADVVKESTRILADGSRVHRESTGKMFRDSAGRLRSEPEAESMVPGAQPRQFITIFDPVQQVAITLDPANKIATISHIPNLSLASEPAELKPEPAAAFAANARTTLPASESLGTLQIEGYPVAGSRRVRTVGGGQIGTEKPLVTRTESWFSSQLKVDLLLKIDDPQFGERTTRLANIQTSEPSLELFQVPADYAVKDVSQRN